MDKPHAPIYTPRDLAELVARHDQEHPDHTGPCDCHNGMVSILRTYFSSAASVAAAVRPYVPPDLVPPRTLEPETRKPWLSARIGETKEEHDYRTAHSCYNCGEFIADPEALNQHEDDCSDRGRRGSNRWGGTRR